MGSITVSVDIQPFGGYTRALIDSTVYLLGGPSEFRSPIVAGEYACTEGIYTRFFVQAVDATSSKPLM